MVRAGTALQVSDADREGLRRSCPISTNTKARRSNTAAWKRPRRTGRAAAVRHDRRHPERRPGQRARHAQHPRRALGDLLGRFRPASVARAAAERRAAGVRVLPPAARCAGARRRTRQAVTARNPDLEKMPMYGVVFSFKDPFDTKDMRSTGGGDAAYDIDFPGARPCAGRAAAQQGRDHLRQGGQHRIQRPRRRSGRAQQARQGAGLDARLSAQHLGRQSVQPLRHHARGLARLELRLRRCRSAPTW